MVEGFPQLPLGKIVANVIDNRGKTPPWGENEPIELIETASIVGENKYPDYSLVQKRVSKETYDNWFRGHPRAKDILIATVGANIGNLSIMKEARGCVAQNLVCLRVDTKQADPDFIYYFLTWQPTQVSLKNLDIGAAQPSIKVPHLLNTKISLPPLSEQRAIAGILGALDDKIEVNRRMNATLEKTAWTIFNKLFIEDEQANKWKYARIGDKLNTYLGGTPSRDNSEYWNNGTIPWINSGKVNEFRVIDATENITKLGLDNSSTKVVPARTTVIAITGATLGQVSLLEIEACTNQSVVSILGSDELPNEFIYFWIKHKIEDLISWQTGGAQQHINKNNVNEFKILCPDPKTMQGFILQVRPIFDLIKNNCIESRTLGSLRDSLLSKLMRGEVRVGI